jgi:hypothetical protein
MGGPLTPSLTPRIIADDDVEDSVPLYFLDEDLAGIEETIAPRTVVSMRTGMGNSFSTGIPAYKAFTSAIKKPSSSSTSKLKKLVRFLDRVEIVPATRLDQNPLKRQKISPTSSNPSFYSAETDSDPDTIEEIEDGIEDEIEVETPNDAIAAGLGRAGSPNKSPTRSPNASTRDLPGTGSPNHSPKLGTYSTSDGYLTPPPPSPPPSWRIPPESLSGRQPHVRSPPRVRSPMRADEEIDLRVNEHCPSPSESADEDEEIKMIRPGVSIVRRSNSPPTVPLHPVIARKMWRHGEVRFEDQWGRRLVPVKGGEAFRFDVWPVEEAQEEGGAVRGAWVRGREGYRGDV